MTTIRGDYRAFGRRLRAARVALGIPEDDAAQSCRVSVKTYRKFEAGSPMIGRSSGVIDFILAHDLDIDWIMDGRIDGEDKAAETNAPLALKLAEAKGDVPELVRWMLSTGDFVPVSGPDGGCHFMLRSHFDKLCAEGKLRPGSAIQ